MGLQAAGAMVIGDCDPSSPDPRLVTEPPRAWQTGLGDAAGHWRGVVPHFDAWSEDEGGWGPHDAGARWRSSASTGPRRSLLEGGATAQRCRAGGGGRPRFIRRGDAWGNMLSPGQDLNSYA